jgi:transcriptional regulator
MVATANEVARTTVTLLKEYADKLRILQKQGERVWRAEGKDSREQTKNLQSWQGMKQAYGRLSMTMRRLSQTASQLIQNNVVEETFKLELEVRLAELEAELLMGDRLFHSMDP